MVDAVSSSHPLRAKAAVVRRSVVVRTALIQSSGWATFHVKRRPDHEVATRSGLRRQGLIRQSEPTHTSSVGCSGPTR